jgi:hypothetical protein
MTSADDAEVPLLNQNRPQGKLTDMDKQIRSGFVSKVFGIVGAQLSLTAIVSAIIYAQGKTFAMNFMWVNVIAQVVLLGTLCVMMCNPQKMREHPTNQYILWTLTGAMSVGVGFVCSMYTAQSVLLAFGMTALITVSMGCLAKFGGHDFTGMGAYLLGALIALICWGFMIMIFSAMGLAQQWMIWLYDLAGVMLFTLYLVFDIQMVLGGKQHEFGVDDYVFAALNIYLDIINIFLHLLRLFGERR